MKVENNMFSKSGDLKIKCTSAIDPIYWKSAETIVYKEEKTYYLSLWNLGKIFALNKCIKNILLISGSEKHSSSSSVIQSN